MQMEGPALGLVALCVARDFATLVGMGALRSQVRMNVPLNNNRSNRRRGRGNNRSQGGNQLNRIDSRARGTAPQLLEKYKKLAHDASLNGDRVQTEYYLQFADHYFRVIADTKARQDEQRGRRDDHRDQQGDGDEEDEFSSYGADRGSYGADRGRSRRPERDEMPSQDSGAEPEAGEAEGEGERADTTSAYEPVENPFTRGNRERSPQRRPRKPRNEQPADTSTDTAAEAPAEPGFDLSVLPPAIGERRDEDEVQAEPAEKAPRRRRTIRAKPAAEGDDESLQKVG